MPSHVLSAAMLAIVVGNVALGLFIGYHAYRGFRRHRSGPMRYLSVGLILLTAIASSLAFFSWLAIRYGFLPETLGDPLALLYRLLQFAGLVLIAYSLYQRP